MPLSISVCCLSPPLFLEFYEAENNARPIFLVLSALDSGLVVGFALLSGEASSPVGDGLMLASIIVCGYGYAEGARLSRSLGGWKVISWALIISLPVMLLLSFLYMPQSWGDIRVSSFISLVYVSLFSMYIGYWLCILVSRPCTRGEL